MLTQEAMDKLEDYNTKLTLDDRGDIAELLMEFELFRQYTLKLNQEVINQANNIKRD